ncbi:MAG: hypothetical protein AAF432_11410 [Planctomycetota bacterium]
MGALPRVVVRLMVVISLILGTSSSIAQSEATSWLGRTLERPSIPDETRTTFEANLETARTAWEASPDDEERIIWYGRRIAYLGRYQEAIEVFTAGLASNPDSYRLYRHRGHRYITTRQLSEAIADLERAAALAVDQPDQIEPDGLPNARNAPTSTDHTNIWYHLGLAHYLAGDFPRAHRAFDECAQRSTTDDMHCAAAYWRFLSRSRYDGIDAARADIDFVSGDLDIIENDAYHALLMLFAGRLARADVTPPDDGVQNATLAYGLATWDLLHGRYDAAQQQYDAITSSSTWAAFGFIAAEAEIARRF